jgi:hypothetical protein
VSGQPWYTDDTGVQPNGDHGGDIGVGDSFSVRYRRLDLPGSMITVTFYPVEYPDCPGEIVVQREIEFLVCTNPADPGSTEVWSEESTDDTAEVHDSVAEAEAAARELAEIALGHADLQTWNGLGFDASN